MAKTDIYKNRLTSFQGKVLLGVLVFVFFLTNCASTNKPYPSSTSSLAVIQEQISDGELEIAEKNLKDILSANNENFAAHQLMASLYSFQEDQHKALQYLSKLIEQFPDRVEPLQIRGDFLLQNFYYLSAWDDLLLAYQKGARNSALLEGLSLLAHERGEIELAIQFLEEAVAIAPVDDKLWYQKALLEIKSNKLENGYTSIQRAIRLKPNSFQYHKLFLEVLERTRDFERIPLELQTIKETFPNEAYGYLKLSGWFLRERKLNESTEILKEGINKISDDGDLFFQLGAILFIQQKFDESLHYFQKGLKINPSSVWAKVQIAKLYFQLKDLDKAISYLKTAHQEGAQDLFVFLQLAKYYITINDTFSAEEILLVGLDYFPKNTALLAEYATLLEKRWKFKEAIEIYQLALKGNPNNYYFFGRIGRLLWLTGEAQKATEYLTKSIKLKKDEIWTRALYIEILLTLKEWDKALNEISVLLKLDSNNYWAYSQKALLEYKLGKPEQALADINKAIVLSPNSAWLKEKEAIILESLERYDMAEISIKEALKLKPEYIHLWTHLGFVQALQGKKEGVQNIEKAINIDKFDLWTIEIFQFLKGKSDHLWGFQKGDPVRKIYQDILFRRFNKAQQKLKESNLSQQRRNQLLYLMRKVKNEEEEVTAALLEEALTKEGKEIGWYIFYSGLSLLEKNQYQKAITVLKRALRLTGGNPWINLKIGFAYEKLEKHQEAIKYINNFLTVFPKHKWAKLRLGLNYDLNKEPAKSEKIYLEILEEHSEEDMALNNLAWMYLTTTDEKYRKIDDALKLSLKAVQINPSSENLDTLAEAYYQKKEYKKSIKIIERALDNDQRNLDYFKKQKKKIEKALKQSQEGKENP